MKNLTSFLILSLLLTVASTAALAFPGGAPSGAAPAAQANPAAPKGTVVETMNSGGYTYLQIENGGQKLWAAVPQTEVKVGQKVELSPGMTMQQFTSKTLGRTFDSIYFCQGVVSAK